MQMGRLNKMVIAAAAILVFLAGCAGVGKRLEPPRVKMANIRPESFNMLETGP